MKKKCKIDDCTPLSHSARAPPLTRIARGLRRALARAGSAIRHDVLAELAGGARSHHAEHEATQEKHFQRLA